MNMRHGKNMGILNDIVRRDIEGKPNTEALRAALEELYSPRRYSKRLVRAGTYKDFEYIICSRNEYPYVIITTYSVRMKYSDISVRDMEGNERILYVDRYSSMGTLSMTVVYNGQGDYIPQMNENGRIRTLEMILKETEWFIDRILKNDFVYVDGYGENMARK